TGDACRSDGTGVGNAASKVGYAEDANARPKACVDPALIDDAAGEGGYIENIDGGSAVCDNRALVGDPTEKDRISESADTSIDSADHATGRVDNAAGEAGNLEDENCRLAGGTRADRPLVGDAS